MRLLVDADGGSVLRQLRPDHLVRDVDPVLVWRDAERRHRLRQRLLPAEQSVHQLRGRKLLHVQRRHHSDLLLGFHLREQLREHLRAGELGMQGRQPRDVESGMLRLALRRDG